MAFTNKHFPSYKATCRSIAAEAESKIKQMCCLLRSLTLLMPWFWSSFLKISSKMGLSLWQHLTGRQKVKTNILPVLPKSNESQYLTKQLYLYHTVFNTNELSNLQEPEIVQLILCFFLFLRKKGFSLNLTPPLSQSVPSSTTLKTFCVFWSPVLYPNQWEDIWGQGGWGGEKYRLFWICLRIGKDHILQKRGEMRSHSFPLSNSETCRCGPPAWRRVTYQDANFTFLQAGLRELLKWRVVSISTSFFRVTSHF